ncbi:unnamed protein product [Coregonus sp. 'balchen']|nr:unnamed protein product [Coregonus sp. 'balchen']
MLSVDMERTEAAGWKILRDSLLLCLFAGPPPPYTYDYEMYPSAVRPPPYTPTPPRTDSYSPPPPYPGCNRK